MAGETDRTADEKKPELTRREAMLLRLVYGRLAWPRPRPNPLADAFLAHPIGGLGQDNFADYYVKRRHTLEEPSWTHSLEMRLLAHTGAVGFLLFVGFLITGLRVAGTVRRRGSPLTRGVAAVAMLPLVVWLIHGSIDWF